MARILGCYADRLPETIRIRVSHRNGECEAFMDDATHHRSPVVFDHILCHCEAEGLREGVWAKGERYMQSMSGYTAISKIRAAY